MKNIWTILGFAITGLALLNSCTPPPFPVGFHMETGSEGGKTFSVLQAGKYYDRVPFMALKDFEKFESFPSEDLSSFGVIFYAKPQMKTRLEAYTGQNQGKCILPTVNGQNKPITYLGTGPITTGRLTIWSGITPDDLKRISETVEPKNKELEEKRINAVKIKGENQDKRKPVVISEKRGRL